MKNIILIDMQKGFMTDSNAHLIEKINRYLKENFFDNIFLQNVLMMLVAHIQGF